jgi:hypothetical protein
MILAKKQGAFEVFSRGVEEPWAVYRDNVPFKQVWTWQEVEKILGSSEAPASSKPAKPTAGLKAAEIRAALKARGYRIKANSKLGPGWEAWAVHRDLPVLSTSGHPSQLEALRELHRKAVASGTIA